MELFSIYLLFNIKVYLIYRKVFMGKTLRFQADISEEEDDLVTKVMRTYGWKTRREFLKHAILTMEIISEVEDPVLTDESTPENKFRLVLGTRHTDGV